MPRINWKNIQPTSIRHSMELCLEYARVKHNRSVDHVSDMMGQANRWTLYKWLENGRLPSILIRPFEAACGADYVTRYISHSAHKLLVDIPTGKRASNRDVNALQASFTEAVSQLLSFYDNQQDAEATLGALYHVMEQLAVHHGHVEKYRQPELNFDGDSE